MGIFEKKITEQDLLSVPALQPVSFFNGWLEYSPEYGFSLYKDKVGTVFIRGLLKNGNLSSGAFYLPVGYRPSKRIITNCRAASGSVRVDVFPTGLIQIFGFIGNWVSLSISFKAEQ